MTNLQATAAGTRVPSRNSTGWRPLLRGAEAARAREAVVAIAEAILDQPPVRELQDAREQDGRLPDDATLASGDAGLALFYAYMAQSGLGEDHRETAIRLLHRSAESLAVESLLPWLHEGFTGVAWAVEHLGSRLFGSSDEDPNESIDEALETFLAHPFQTGEFELLTGLSGLGVYALERLPRPSARLLLRRIVDRLDELAVKSPGGIVWPSGAARTPSTLVGSPRNELRYNLGLSHGIPGAIAFLGAAYAAGISRKKVKALLDGAMSWFLQQELPAASRSRFPTVVIEGVEPKASRLAWCYGDAGIAAALMSAALHTGERSWEMKATEIAIAAANRSFPSSEVADAGLCHGAAGLAHVFNRLYAATGEEALAEASRRWFLTALSMREPGTGIGGYLSWEPVEGGGSGWVAGSGFLTGASGIALAFLGAITDVEPEWDRVLLTNLPVKEWR